MAEPKGSQSTTEKSLQNTAEYTAKTRVWCEAIGAKELHLNISNIDSQTFKGRRLAIEAKRAVSLDSLITNYLKLRKLIENASDSDSVRLKALAVDHKVLISELSKQVLSASLEQGKSDSEYGQRLAQSAFYGYYTLDKSDPLLEKIYAVWYQYWTHNESVIKAKAAQYK